MITDADFAELDEVQQWLARFAIRGVRVRIVGDAVRLVNADLLAPPELAWLKAHRAAIRRLYKLTPRLQPEPPTAPSSGEPVPSRPQGGEPQPAPRLEAARAVPGRPGEKPITEREILQTLAFDGDAEVEKYRAGKITAAEGVRRVRQSRKELAARQRSRPFETLNTRNSQRFPS